jgi:hypothetical protein
MSLTDYKIEPGDYIGQDVMGLPDQVVGDAAALKARFDALVKQVVAPKINGLIDALIYDIAAMVSDVDDRVKYTDVQDSLTSTDTDKPLSAAQGKALQDSTVKTTGDQTITGTKTFNADQRLSNGRRFYAGSGTARGIGENGPGVVGVFADTSLQVLNAAGAAFRPVLASAFTESSSHRWKNNINPFSDEKARKLLDIELKTFTYKPEFNDDGGAVHMGVIAEQIIGLFPDAVTLDDEGLPSGVDYSKLVVPCIGMIQRQQNEIDALKEAVKALQGD